MTTALPDAPRNGPPTTSGFAGLAIGHAGGVLTPRDWTSLQAGWGRELLDRLPGGPVLELCCGAGHIGLAATTGTSRRLVQVDLSPRAVAWAHHNAVAHGRADRVDIRRGDLGETLAPHERFVLVLADPPYLRTDEVALYPGDPRHAIDGGPDGTAIARRVLDTAARHLTVDGVVLLQTRGRRQVDALRTALPARGMQVEEIREFDPDRAVVLLRRVEPAS